MKLETIFLNIRDSLIKYHKELSKSPLSKGKIRRKIIIKMANARDLAKFITKHTGYDFVSLYDESVKLEQELTQEEITQERIGDISKPEEEQKKL